MLLASPHAKLAAQSLQEFLLLLGFTPWGEFSFMRLFSGGDSDKAVGASRWSMLLSDLVLSCYFNFISCFAVSGQEQQ
jgi:hypothetical protein